VFNGRTASVTVHDYEIFNTDQKYKRRESSSKGATISSDSNSRASIILLLSTHPRLYLTMATSDSVFVLISITQEPKEFLSTVSTANTLYIDLEGKSLS
jgi:hypothetical protein